MPTKKILIFYITMGTGHKRTADLLSDILSEHGGDDLTVMKVAETDLIGSSDIKAIVGLWNFLLRKNMLKTADFIMSFFTRLFVLPFLDVTRGPSMIKKLEEIRPEVIISTGVGWNKCLDQYCRDNRIPFFVFVMEAFPNFIDTIGRDAANLCYFNESCQVAKSYDFNLSYYSREIKPSTGRIKRLGYLLSYFYEFLICFFKNDIFHNLEANGGKANNARCLAVGPIAEKKFFISFDRGNVRKKLGINNDFPVALVASGGIGGKFVQEIAREISNNYRGKLNLILACGRDKDCFDNVKKIFPAANADVSILPLTFIDNFNEILSVADVVICRPSSGIFIESLLVKTPLIIFNHFTSNDTGCVEMIKKYRLGEICATRRQLPGLLSDFLKRRETYVDNINFLLRQYPDDYQFQCKKIFDTIIGDEQIN